MKVNGGISIGNILTIIVLILSLAMGWGAMDSTLKSMEYKLVLKANKDVVDTHFLYIQKQLDEIKTMLEEKEK